ncbi:homoserine kinase [Bacillus piscicola]|uniref:homoserine kinase n=1 Tax=Bacillus piscicola TaxID=1632684 RepID=UPI001F09A126
MAGKKLVITVPASSANLGPGFDSIGLAVNRYLTLEAEQAEEWSFESESPELATMPAGNDNLVYKAASGLAEELGVELPPCHVKMTTEIPLARGLGSSAAAIVAAIELVNGLTRTELSIEEKLRYASLWEGHPDNVGPCLYGGLIVGTHSKVETNLVHCGVPDVDLVLAVPSSELLTEEARGILPESLNYADAIRGSSIGNVLVAALLKEEWDLVGRMMGSDIFHHPYREKLVPGLTDIINNARRYGAYGAALSGAGPTIVCLAPAGEGSAVCGELQKDYPDFHIYPARPAPFGATVRYVEDKSFSS